MAMSPFVTDKPRIDQILWRPLQTPASADLEAATKIITATSEASGVANADYTQAYTLSTSPDARLAILRSACRSSIVTDSLNGGCASVRCRVYVDAQDASHMLFDITITSATTTITNQDLFTGTKDAIWALLKDGAAHTFYWFFWVDAGNVVLSAVQLWALNAASTTNSTTVASITHTGLMTEALTWTRVQGSGNVQIIHHTSGTSLAANLRYWIGNSSADTGIGAQNISPPHYLHYGTSYYWMSLTVSADLGLMSAFVFNMEVR